jgi:hypothetical protein
MLKVIVNYTRYILALLAIVGFGLAINAAPLILIVFLIVTLLLPARVAQAAPPLP